MTAMTRRIKKLFLPISIIASIFFLYWHTLGNPLIFDDAFSLNLFYYFTKKFNQHPTSFWLTSWDFIKILLTEPDRYLAFVSFDLIGSFSNDFFWQRSFNVLLHAVNSLLIFSFIERLFKNKKTALFCCLFFAFNPASIHAVCYLVQRNILMMVMFGLSQCVLFLKAIETKSEVRATIFFLLSVLLFLLCKFCKEQGLMFALMFPILSIGHASKRVLVYNLAIVPFGLWLGLKKMIALLWFTPDLHENGRIILEACRIETAGLYLKSIVTQCWLFFKYFLIWIFPIQTSIDMREPLRESLWYAIPFLLFSLAGLKLIIKRGTRILGIGILSSVVLFIPELSTIRLGEIFVVYRSYAFFGFIIIIGYFINSIWILKPRYQIIPFLLFIPIFFVTSKGLKQFEKSSWTWLKAASLITSETQCQASRIYNWIFTSQLQEIPESKNTFTNLIMARDYSEKAMRIHPRSSRSNYGTIHEFLGMTTKARKIYEDIIAHPEENHPINVENAYNGLGNIEQKEGNYTRALELYRTVLKMNPTHTGANINLVNLENALKERSIPTPKSEN